ncbi:hypothetical protein D3C85_1002840 [compost metagenome]
MVEVYRGGLLLVELVDVTAQTAQHPVVAVLFPAGQRQCAVIARLRLGRGQQTRRGHGPGVIIQRLLRLLPGHQPCRVAVHQRIALRCFQQLREQLTGLARLAHAGPGVGHPTLIVGLWDWRQCAQLAARRLGFAAGNQRLDQTQLRFTVLRSLRKGLAVVAFCLAGVPAQQGPVGYSNPVIGIRITQQQRHGLRFLPAIAQRGGLRQHLAALQARGQVMHVLVPGGGCYVLHRRQRFVIAGMACQVKGMGIARLGVQALALQQRRETVIGRLRLIRGIQAVGQPIGQPRLVGG